MSEDVGAADQHDPTTGAVSAWIKRLMIVAVFAMFASSASMLLYALALRIFSPDTLGMMVVMALIGAGQADTEPDLANYFFWLLFFGAPTAMLAAIGLLMVDSFQRKIRSRLWLVAIAALVVGFALVMRADGSSLPRSDFVFAVLEWTKYSALSVLPGFWLCHFLTRSARSKLVEQRARKFQPRQKELVNG